MVFKDCKVHGVIKVRRLGGFALLVFVLLVHVQRCIVGDLSKESRKTAERSSSQVDYFKIECIVISSQRCWKQYDKF